MALTLLKYIGSKRRMVNKLASLIPPNCDTTLEAFAGSAAFSINIDAGYTKILSDKNYQITNLLRIIAYKKTGDQLVKRIESMTLDELAFKAIQSRQKEQGILGIDSVGMAAETWFLYNYSFNGKADSFSNQPRNKERQMKQLQKIVDTLSKQDITIHNKNAIELLQKDRIINNPNMFIYLDPPYVAGTRSAARLYKVDMPEVTKHIDLLRTVQHAKAKVVLSGYDSELYNFYLLNHGWHKYILGEYSQTCNIKSDRKKAREIIWANYLAYEVPDALQNIKEYQ